MDEKLDISSQSHSPVPEKVQAPAHTGAPTHSSLTHQEQTRLNVIAKLHAKEITAAQAALVLGLSKRQILRLSKAVRKEGHKGVVSKKKGAPSNNRLPETLKEQALSLIKEHYANFGPSLAHECLVERHGLKISKSTVRNLMVEHNLWKPKSNLVDINKLAS